MGLERPWIIKRGDRKIEGRSLQSKPRCPTSSTEMVTKTVCLAAGRRLPLPLLAIRGFGFGSHGGTAAPEERYAGGRCFGSLGVVTVHRRPVVTWQGIGLPGILCQRQLYVDRLGIGSGTSNIPRVAGQPGNGHCSSESQKFRALHTRAEAVAISTSKEVDELADIDWDGLGFGIRPTDYMYLMKCVRDGELFEGDLRPFGTIELSPSAGVLNYGQGLFEGLKAYRGADGRILLFRPEENALRMIMGADRLCMKAPSVEQFVEAVKQTVLANKRWIPPHGKGSLYIRPLLLGSGPVLGLAPAPEYTFLIYVSPVGNYFKEGLAPIHLRVENKYHRATPGGTGGIKSIGNYAPVLKTQSDAKAKGFSDVMYLDAVNKKYLEEVSSCNIFVLRDNVISTPALQGTILPGITRKSIIEVARNRGYEVQERLVAVGELMDADEVFCTGTAVVVCPVGSITYLDKRVTYRNGGLGKVSQELYSVLTNLQMGLAEDNMGWTMELK